MANISRGLSRIYVLFGGMVGLFVFFNRASEYTPPSGAIRLGNLIVAVVFGLIAFVVAWGIPFGVYWVYSGFKEDRISKN